MKFPASIILALAIPAFAYPVAAQDFSLAARQDDFKTFVQNFENNYAYLNRPEKPWLTWEARYGPLVEKAETKEAFDALLASALSELHDFHAEVRSPIDDRWLPVPTFDDLWAEFTANGAMVEAVRHGSDADRAGIKVGEQVLKVGSKPLEQAVEERLGMATLGTSTGSAAARQWALLSVLTGRAEETRTFTLKRKDGTVYTVTLQLKRQFSRPSGVLSVTRLADKLALIRFHNSLGEQKTVAALDAALEQCRNTDGLILDLRDVPSGGDSSVALGIMGRFTTHLVAYQRHRIPNYGQSDVERNWVEFVAPRGPFAYTKPVVVLVDHWTGSMGEGMAIGFDAMHRAVVVGTAMAHLAGAVSDDKLPKTGVDIAYATEQLYHVNGTARQDWLPPVLVPEMVGTPGEDAILKEGIAVLRRSAKRKSAENELTLLPPKP